MSPFLSGFILIFNPFLNVTFPLFISQTTLPSFPPRSCLSFRPSVLPVSAMVRDVLATDGVQEAQAAPDGTDGDCAPINTHRRAERRLAQSPA